VLGPIDVAKGIVRVAARTPTLLPATHTNSYALGTREVLLVEPATPFDDELREWLLWARGLVSAGRTIVGLFATHHHPDHVGGLDVLVRELDVPLFAHDETFARVSHDPDTVRRYSEGDEISLDGPEPMVFRVLHTPGHAKGHLCLHDEAEGSLVVGDMVASEGTILIAPGEGDMIDYLAELARLGKIDAKVALPAHGDPIGDPRGLFRRYVTHRLLREAKVLAAVREAGQGDLDALVPLAYADTPPAIFPIAKLSLEAHLEKLVKDGTVVHDGRTYRATEPGIPR